MLIFGGTALAATAPIVAPLKFEFTDANNNKVEIKMVTGYEANRVAVDKNGNTYVTDAVSNTVSVFNTNGRLVRQLNVNRPSAIGIDNASGLVYVSGVQNGIRNIHIFDMNGNGKGSFSTVREWDYPASIAVAAGDIYVADGSVVRRIDAEGAIVKDYGPYAGKCTDGTNDDKCKSELFGGITYYNTRHRMAFPQGVAVDEANKLLYVSIKEFTETLKTSCTSVTINSDGTTGSTSTSDTSGNCTVDTTESWMYYKNTLGVATIGSTYKYWNAIDTKQATSYYVLVIDIDTGNLTGPKKIAIDPLYNWDYSPKGLALDGKGRLYVAVSGVGTGSGDIRVYDVATGAKLSLNSTFASCTPSTACPDGLGWYSGMYAADVVFSPNAAYDSDSNVAEAKGRLFATIGDSKIVSTYLIDNGTNPDNTAPTAPVLFDPDPAKSNVVVATKKPTLKIINATDTQNDPLTYAYEVYEIDKSKVKISNPITPPSMFAEGNEKVKIGEDSKGNPIYITLTSMIISSDLKENSLYSWKARSFDGEKEGVDEREGNFCVDAENENPTAPAIQNPADMAIAPPLTTYLQWSPSVDPDCYGTVTYYTVEVSEDAAFGTIPFSKVSNSTSVRISDIKGLINGMVYHWRVKAVDANGGVSYSAGRSFIYNYKTGAAGFGSNQPGTKVYIDGNYGYYGRFLGETPMEEVGGIAVGRHFVVFVKTGYEPYYAIVDVKDPAQGTTEPVIATMVSASRIKPPATGGTIKGSNGGDITAAANSTPFVVDYNNDGVKDVLVGGGDGKVYLYISEAADGSIVPLRFKGAIQAYDSITKTSSDINVASDAVPFVVDYNSDGRKDLLIGSSDGSTYLCLNIGEDSAPIFASSVSLQDKDGSDIKAISNLAPAVVDYNNDGKKDLVVGSSDGTFRLYINVGSDESPEFGAPVAIKADGVDLNVGFDSKAFFTDWNSDGKKDLVVGDGSGKGSLFLNIGNDNEPEFKSISGLQQWIKEKKRERGNREFVPYLGYNQDLGDLTGGSGEASPFVVDWDGTSARDVIVGNGSGGVATYITE